MANVLKLVYSALNFSELQTGSEAARIFNSNNHGLTDQNPYYYSVVFTADGKIVTHGKVYNTVEGGSFVNIKGISNADDPVQLSLNNNGILSATLKDLYNTDLATWTYGLHGLYNNQNELVDAYEIKVPLLTIDTYGRVTAISLHNNVIHADYVKSVVAGNGKTYYLLGHETVPAANVNTIASTLANNKLKASTDSSGNLTLTTLKLVVTDGANNVTFGTGNNAKTLLEYINEAKTLAMSFKGTTDSITLLMNLPPNSVENGDTYKFTGNTTDLLESTRSSDGQNHDVVTGDILIAVKNDSGLKWAYVPSGDDDVVVDVRILTGATDAGTGEPVYNYLKSSGYVTLGNAALSTVFNGTLATNTTSNDLTTATLVAALVSAHAGTVTSITPGEGLKSSITANTWGTNAIITSGSLKVIAATNTAFGGIKLYLAADSSAANISAATKNYAIKLDKNGIAYVNVPWENTTYTVNDAKLTLKIDNLQISDTFTANASSDAVYTIPLASFNSSTSTSIYGAIKGTDHSNVDAYSTSPVVNGVVYYQNTWRPVLAYNINQTRGVDSSSLGGSTGTKTLAFGSEFGYAEDDTTINDENTSELHLVWAEIDSKGAMTYHV